MPIITGNLYYYAMAALNSGHTDAVAFSLQLLPLPARILHVSIVAIVIFIFILFTVLLNTTYEMMRRKRNLYNERLHNLYPSP
jgi:hypothetical protein